MEILHGKIKCEVKKIVERKAKYQKVMLIYDNFVSNIETNEIYNEIKEICIYNACNIASIDENELNNGYRLIIFVCCVDSFLKSNIKKSEFINVFCPKDEGYLPYLLNDEFCFEIKDLYLINENSYLDVGAISSICVNQFINYFENILYNKDVKINYSFVSREKCHQDAINNISSLDQDLKFYDIEIIKSCKLDYKNITLIDLVLIDAFLLLINSIKNHTYTIVDVYKSAKENNDLIDKFYSLANNETFNNLVVLNFNCLYSFCIQTKQKILDCVNVFDYSEEQVEGILKKIKCYFKENNGILMSLYFYNIFGV